MGQSGSLVEGQRASAILKKLKLEIVVVLVLLSKENSCYSMLINLPLNASALSCDNQKLKLTLDLIKTSFQRIPRSFGMKCFSRINPDLLLA